MAIRLPTPLIRTNMLQQLTTHRALKTARMPPVSHRIHDPPYNRPSTTTTRQPTAACWRLAAVRVRHAHLHLRRIHTHSSPSSIPIPRWRHTNFGRPSTPTPRPTGNADPRHLKHCNLRGSSLAVILSSPASSPITNDINISTTDINVDLGSTTTATAPPMSMSIVVILYTDLRKALDTDRRWRGPPSRRGLWLLDDKIGHRRRHRGGGGGKARPGPFAFHFPDISKLVPPTHGCRGLDRDGDLRELGRRPGVL